MRNSKFGQNKVGFPSFHSDLLERLLPSILWWQLSQVLLSESTNMRTKAVSDNSLTTLELMCSYKGLQGSQDRLQQKEQEQEQMTLARPRTYILARRLFQVSDTECSVLAQESMFSCPTHGSTEVIICQAFATGFVPLCEEGWLSTDAMVMVEEYRESWWILNSIPQH